jgi:iron-sulfur cluster repair protein YtfE (RIC family)
MLRDKNLIPLSHQHQHALALCVRIDRAVMNAAVVKNFAGEIEEMWARELRFHFEAEETVLFPETARVDGLRELTEELIAEHRAIEGMANGAREKLLDGERLQEFALVLSGHVRKEERQLFEGLQQKLTAEKLGELGERMSVILGQAEGQSCGLRAPAQGKKQPT